MKLIAIVIIFLSGFTDNNKILLAGIEDNSYTIYLTHIITKTIDEFKKYLITR